LTFSKTFSIFYRVVIHFLSGRIERARHFCPSCHQKRVVEFGEWLCQKVIKEVPHRHFIFSIPKMFRRYFLYDRKPLSELSRYAWKSVKVFFQEALPEEGSVALVSLNPGNYSFFGQ